MWFILLISLFKFRHLLACPICNMVRKTFLPCACFLGYRVFDKVIGFIARLLVITASGIGFRNYDKIFVT